MQKFADMHARPGFIRRWWSGAGRFVLQKQSVGQLGFAICSRQRVDVDVKAKMGERGIVCVQL